MDTPSTSKFSNRRRGAMGGTVCRLLWFSFIVLIGTAAPSLAHPLGNFSVNRYSRLELYRDSIRIHYIVDMAEIPAFRELGLMDADEDGAVSREERRDYLKGAARRLRGRLSLAIGGATRELVLVARELTTPPGQAGLDTLRLHLILEAALPPLADADAWRVRYRDDNYNDRLGWREIVVRPMPGMALLTADVSRIDQSDELRHYPRDRLTDAPDIRQATLTFALDGAPGTTRHDAPQAVAPQGPRPGRLAALLETDRLTLPITLLALLTAAGLGALHALSPGHGKAVVGAFLVGTRGTARHALVLGLTVTATHTIGVFALGVITLWASRYLLPEQVFPWLGIASGIIVAAMGATLLGRRLRGGAHPHPHNHHDHDHGLQGHRHPHPHGGGHDHGRTGSGPTWRGLLALGVSGGLLPCPSALVVLLGAVALGRIGFGMLLILAFSLGLATVLTIVGLVFVYARNLFSRFPRSRVVMTVLPVFSAVIITIAGLGVMLKSAWPYIGF